MRASRRGSALQAAAALIMLLGASSLSVPDVAAQLYSTLHRPAGAGYFQFQTPHFQLIYQRGLFDEAGETARLLERVYPEVRAAVGLRRRLDVPVILNHYTDQANGFVSPWPFRQEIEAVNLRGKALSPQFPSWFETVGPHELAHAAHAESGKGFGIGWILRQIGPDLARSLNLSGPRGMNEGAAVWVESKLHPEAGRLEYSLFEMQFRAAMLSDDPWSLVQMLEPPAYTRPFDRYYNGGAHLFEYLAGVKGIDFFRKTTNFYYRFPLLGYAPALWYGTGMMPHLLSRRMRRHFETEAREFVEGLGPISQAETIVSAEGAVFRRPRWVDDETLLAYASGYDRRPGFYRIGSSTGVQTAVAHEAISEDAYFSLSRDRTHVYFTRYVPSTFTPARAIAEVFRLDLTTGAAERLTRGGRAYAAVEAAGARGPESGPTDGALRSRDDVWLLKNVTQFNEWRTAGGALVGALERTILVAVEPSMDGERVAVVANHAGRQGVYEAVLQDGMLVAVEPWVVPAAGSVFDASWSPDGRFVVFSADPDGVANIYALEISSGRVTKLTNVAYGAIEPSVSPDGKWLAYVNYRHERYELVRTPFAPEGEAASFPFAEDADAALTLVSGPPQRESLTAGRRSDVAVGDGVDEGAAAEGRRVAAPFSPKKYRALAQVRPRVVYPFLVYQRESDDPEDVSLGFGGGAGVEWADPLRTWAAHTSGYYQHGTWWGRVAMQSGRWVARPSVDAFRSPSTVSVLERLGDGRVDTVRVGREERGVGVGVRTPVVLQSNVYQTHGRVSMRAEYRQERLFGRDNETLREADDRLTLNPSVQFVYRGQQNPRDLVPNSGVFATVVSKVDLWAESGRAARWVRADGRVHIPLLQGTNTGVQLHGRLLAQNRGGVVSLSAFFPRGYETADAFLGRGAFSTYGLEITQPLWYVDDGFFLIPLYVKAVFAYGFAESMQGLGGGSSTDRLTVAGAGLGIQLRFAHSIDFTLRVAPVYKFMDDEWDWTLR